MTTINLHTAEDVSALVLSLPEAERARLVAETTADGYVIHVPDDLAAAVAAIDIAAAQTAALEAAARSAVDQHVETVATAKGYNSAASCASYATSTNPTWAAEAGVFVAWRDAVWTHVFGVLAAAEAGTEPAPTIAALIAGLPAIAWPAA